MPRLTGNYLAGDAKKRLRIKRWKDAPQWGNVFLRLPIEVKLLVSAQAPPLACRISVDSRVFSAGSRATAPHRPVPLLPHLQGLARAHHGSQRCRRLEGGLSQLPGTPRTPTEKDLRQLGSPHLRTWHLRGNVLPSSRHTGIQIRTDILQTNQVCGRLGGLTDFAFLRRFCEPCMVRPASSLPNAHTMSDSGLFFHSGHIIRTSPPCETTTTLSWIQSTSCASWFRAPIGIVSRLSSSDDIPILPSY